MKNVVCIFAIFCALMVVNCAHAYNVLIFGSNPRYYGELNSTRFDIDSYNYIGRPDLENSTNAFERDTHKKLTTNNYVFVSMAKGVDEEFNSTFRYGDNVRIIQGVVGYRECEEGALQNLVSEGEAFTGLMPGLFPNKFGELEEKFKPIDYVIFDQGTAYATGARKGYRGNSATKENIDARFNKDLLDDLLEIMKPGGKIFVTADSSFDQQNVERAYHGRVTLTVSSYDELSEEDRRELDAVALFNPKYFDKEMHYKNTYNEGHVVVKNLNVHHPLQLQRFYTLTKQFAPS